MRSELKQWNAWFVFVKRTMPKNVLRSRALYAHRPQSNNQNKSKFRRRLRWVNTQSICKINALHLWRMRGQVRAATIGSFLAVITRASIGLWSAMIKSTAIIRGTNLIAGLRLWVKSTNYSYFPIIYTTLEDFRNSKWNVINLLVSVSTAWCPVQSSALLFEAFSECPVSSIVRKIDRLNTHQVTAWMRM